MYTLRRLWRFFVRQHRVSEEAFLADRYIEEKWRQILKHEITP